MSQVYRCDKCKRIVDKPEGMVQISKGAYAGYRTFYKGEPEWDLCPKCWKQLKKFINKNEDSNNDQ